MRVTYGHGAQSQSLYGIPAAHYVMCVCKNETGEDDNTQLALNDSVLDGDLPQLPDTDQDTPATSSRTTPAPAARKRRQSEFNVQCGKSMECLQELMKARLAKKTDDDDDIFGKMIASKCRKIKNPRVKRTLQKKINDLIFEAEEEDEAVNSVGTSDQVFFVLQPNQQIAEQ